MSVADYGALFEQLHAKHHDKERVKIQLAPANLHWCSDAALTSALNVSVQATIVNITAIRRPPRSRTRRRPAR